MTNIIPPNIRQVFTGHHHDRGLFWENLARTAVVLSLMLVPWLVLPISNDAWEMHKVAALLALTSLAWIFSWVASWQRREYHWSWQSSDWLVLGVLALLGLGAGLSLDPWYSFAGAGGSWSETVPVLAALASWWWLWPILFFAPGPRRLLGFGLAAGLVGALVFQVFQLLGFPLTPNLSTHPLFSVISQTPFDVAVVAAMVGTAVMVWWSKTTDSWQRWLLAAVMAVSWLVLFFFQQLLAWGVFAFGMMVVVIFESRPGRQARTGVVVGGVLLAGFGILAQVTGLPAQSAVPSSVEVRMDAAHSWQVTRTALSKRPILGAGPNNWYQAFIQYRSEDFNSSPWWNIRFIKGHDAWSQALGTFGILGSLAVLVLFLSVGRRLWQAWRQHGHPVSLLGSLVLAVTVAGGFFMTWSLVWWMLIWATLAGARLVSITERPAARPLGPIPLAVTALATLALVWFWYPAGRLYASVVAVEQAQAAIARTDPLEEVQAKLSTALSRNPNNLSAVELLGHAYATQAELAAQSGQTDRVVEYVRQAITSVQAGMERRARDPLAREIVNNLLNRLSPFVTDAETAARDNFAALQKLEPGSPIHDVGYGQTLLVTRSRLLSGEEVTDETRAQASQLLAQAQAAFAKALEKKADYLPAFLAQAQAYNVADQPDQALATLDQVLTEGPNYALYWRERGIAESKLDHATQAENAFDRALAIDPQDVTLYLVYSRHFQDANNLTRAREVLEQGLEVWPGLPALTQALESL